MSAMCVGGKGLLPGMIGLAGRSLAGIAMAAMPQGVMAQTAPVLPAPAFPLQGQAGVTPPSRDELRGITGQAARPAARLSIEGGIERSPCPLDDPQYADIKVTLSQVTFGGLKETGPEELEATWKPLVGTTQPIAVLCEIRDTAGTILRNKGYLAAVQVPTQKIDNGEVRMEVVYARISAIRARGETRGAEAKLEQYLSALTGDEVFNQSRAERYLLLARDLPGYNVQLTLKPAGTAAGDLVGEITVLREPYAVDFTVQNLSSEATGRFGGQVRAQFFGLTGMGDATTLSYYTTADFSEQHIVQGAHEFRPGRHGLIVGGQVTYAWTKPELQGLPAGISIDARTLYASLHARYPLRRSLSGNSWLAGGFDLVNQSVDLIGPLTRDKVRVAWARLDMDAIDTGHVKPQWRVSSSLEVRQGLDILDATDGCTGAACAALTPTSRFDGSPRATVLRWQGEYERAVGAFSILLAPRGQYAFKPLLSFEEFSAGNFTVGRGYDPGDLIGDSAVAGTAELRGPRLPVAGDRDIRLQPFVYVDAAWVWNKGIAGHDRLTSVGGGVRTEIGSRFRLEATLAVPLEKVGLQANRSKPRFLLSLTTRLLPWRTF